MAISLAVRKQPSDLVPSLGLFALVRHFEGFVGYAYDDKEARYPKTPITSANAHTVRGRLTIGYGRARNVQPGDTCTLQQAEEWLLEDLNTHAQIVRDKVQVPLTQSEFDGLTDITYNLGYIPKSMLACLNGGVTDKGVEMAPGSYGSALMQFPRNCRWAGIPNEEVYRRRLADACVFSDLPWSAACSKNIVRLETVAGEPGTIDTDATTSLEDTLMRARQDIPDTRPDPSDIFNKPWPKATTVITDKPELQLDKPLSPAPPLATTGSKEAVGAGPTPQPSPASAPVSPQVSPAPSASVVPPASVTRKPEVVPAPPAQPPRAPVPAPAPKPASPPVVAGEDGTKPKSPWTVQPEDVHYKIDPNAGLKPLEDSDRAKAFYWQRTFMFIIYIGGTGIFGSGMLAGSELLMKHAALMSVVLDLAVPAAMALSALALGAVGKSWADWRRHCAQQRASQALY